MTVRELTLRRNRLLGDVVAEVPTVSTKAIVDALEEFLAKIRKIKSIEEASDEGFIANDEILSGIEQGLTEMFEAKRLGAKEMTIEEFINEL